MQQTTPNYFDVMLRDLLSLTPAMMCCPEAATSAHPSAPARSTYLVVSHSSPTRSELRLVIRVGVAQEPGEQAGPECSVVVSLHGGERAVDSENDPC